MAYATTADIERTGFAASQFGDPPDWAAENGYLATLLAEVALDVRARVGATVYDAAAGVTKMRIARAERLFAAAELQRRHAVFVQRSARVGGSEYTSSLTPERILRAAKAFEEQAEAELAAITGSDAAAGSFLAVGYVETGPLTEVAP